jgi:hypothetical protein
MKMLEAKRMEMLRDEQPDIFLPTDIDYTLEDAMEDNLKGNISILIMRRIVWQMMKILTCLNLLIDLGSEVGKTIIKKVMLMMFNCNIPTLLI